MGSFYDGKAPDIDYRVRLENQRTAGGSLGSLANREVVIFETTPDLVETRNVNYKTIDPVHAPGQMAAYVNTSSRSFNISSVRLISRTPEEAYKTLRVLWTLRSWAMPQFGTSTLGKPERDARDDWNRPSRQDSRARYQTEQERRDAYIEARNRFGYERRGEPPAILLLSAYSNNSFHGEHIGNINRVPVVLQNLSIPYPSDIDYIPAADVNIPVPTIITIDMQLLETHSPREYERFSLGSFKTGTLGGF